MSRHAGLSLSLILLAHPMLAQTVILRGTVADPSGAVIPGAKVTAAVHNGSVKTAVADDKGSIVSRDCSLDSIRCPQPRPNWLHNSQ